MFSSLNFLFISSSFESPSMRFVRFLAALIFLMVANSILSADTLEAQESEPRPLVAASGRAETSVSFDGRLIGSTWLNRSTSHSGPARMILDYGQPHARGRSIFGGVVPYGDIWRLGANMATHLTLDLNVRLGDLDVPRGTYTLYLLPREDGAQLIVNRQTRQWGTEYSPSQDLGRVELRHRDLPETAESLNITLEPILPQRQGNLPEGTLRITWGEVEYSTDWSVIWP